MELTRLTSKKFFLCGLCGAGVLFPVVAFAQVYGSGPYGSQTYGGLTPANPGTTVIGPVTLPVSGGVFWTSLGIMALVLAAVILVRQLRKGKQTPPANS